MEDITVKLKLTSDINGTIIKLLMGMAVNLLCIKFVLHHKILQDHFDVCNMQIWFRPFLFSNILGNESEWITIFCDIVLIWINLYVHVHCSGVMFNSDNFGTI